MDVNNALTIVGHLGFLKTGNSVDIKTDEPIVICYLAHGSDYDPEEAEIASQLFHKDEENGMTRYATHPQPNADHYIKEDIVTTIALQGYQPLDIMLGELELTKGLPILTNSYKLLGLLPEVIAKYYVTMEMNSVPLMHKFPGNVRVQQLTEMDSYRPEWLGITKLHHNSNCVTFTDRFMMGTNDTAWLTSNGASVIIDTAGGTQKTIEEPTHVYMDAGANLVYRSTEEIPLDVLRGNYFSKTGGRNIQTAIVTFQGIKFTIFPDTVVEVH